MSVVRFPTWVNGALRAPGEGVVPADDAGFLLGLSAFETLLYEHGCAHFRERHLARLGEGLAALSIELPPELAAERALDAYRPALDAHVATLGKTGAALRLTVSRGAPGAGPTVVVGAREIVLPPAEGVVVTFVPDVKRAGDELEQLKTTSRLRNVLLFEEARREGAWDALLGNDRGEACEATVANVWCVHEGVVRTPDLASGCLGGVTRELLLAEIPRLGLELRVAPVPLAELARASEVFLSNSTGRVIPVRAVRGVVDGLAGPDGPVARELRDAMRRVEERYRAGRRS